jgi:hypothetical protein
MIDLGTVRPGSTVRIPFSSFDKDDGSSITMTNYAAADILLYKDGSTTERASTAGFTATTDFDAKTGKHLAIIDLADNTTAGFYAAGSEYLVAIDAVTVDAVVTGGWIARFRIGYDGANLDTTIATLSTQTSFTLTTGPAEDDALNGCVCLIHDVASAVQLGYGVVSDYTGSTKTVTLTAGVSFTAAATDNISFFPPANARWFAALAAVALPLTPTTAGRTLDVSATGEAGVDWGNVGSPTTAVNLSATNIDVDQVVASVSGAVGSVTGAVGSVAAGGITAASFAADAITAAKLAADVTTELQSGLATSASITSLDAKIDTIDNFLDTEVAAIKAVTDLLPDAGALTSLATQASVNTIDDLLDTEVAAIKTVVDAIKLKTDGLPSGIQKNAALANFEFLMVLSSDHVSAATGLTVTAQRSIDGAAFAACANSVTEVGSGVYKINFEASDMNGDIITFLFTAATADARVITIATEP